MVRIEWLAFLPAAAVLAATPGANQVLSLRNGLRAGAVPAIAALAGRFSAFLLMVVAVAVGLGAVLATSSLLLGILKWCGVAYLTWLGLRTWLRRGGDATATRAPPTPAGTWRLTRQEFGVAAANPKALLLFTVFLPQFLPAGAAHPGPSLLLLGVAYIGVEFCFACGYALLGARIGSPGLSARLSRRFDALTGGAMLALAAWLATERTAPAR
jgi:threonine/homoserine/homoserine lactone efflux protein